MDARGKFGEHERSVHVRVTRGAAKSNSSFSSNNIACRHTSGLPGNRVLLENYE